MSCGFAGETAVGPDLERDKHCAARRGMDHRDIGQQLRPRETRAGRMRGPLRRASKANHARSR